MFGAILCSRLGVIGITRGSGEIFGRGGRSSWMTC
jgi:hypothetical protein